MEKLNANLANLFLLFTRNPVEYHLRDEVAYFINSDKRYIGIISFDKSDQDIASIILGRDIKNRFVAKWFKTDFSSIELATSWLERTLTEKEHSEEDLPKSIFDIFTPIYPPKKLSHNFKLLNENENLLSAKNVISEIGYHYDDLDGNFIEQFQTNGFDARLWELYLFCYCREELFNFNRVKNVPDFFISKGKIEIAIEAVTIGNTKKRVGWLPSSFFYSKEELKQKLLNEIPLKFLSSLTSKLNKEYWKHEQVIDKPLIFAIADFHDNDSMTWTFPAIFYALYGVQESYHFDLNKNLVVNNTPIAQFTTRSGSPVTAGFFNMPNAENVSAVLFSSTGTIGKFIRIGIQAGLGHPNVRVLRNGAKFDHDANAIMPENFVYEVSEECRENWAEGMSLFLNPNALRPIDKNLFPLAAHHYFRDGQIISEMPSFFPYYSNDINILVRNN